MEPSNGTRIKIEDLAAFFRMIFKEESLPSLGPYRRYGASIVLTHSPCHFLPHGIFFLWWWSPAGDCNDTTSRRVTYTCWFWIPLLAVSNGGPEKNTSSKMRPTDNMSILRGSSSKSTYVSSLIIRKIGKQSCTIKKHTSVIVLKHKQVGNPQAWKFLRAEQSAILSVNYLSR
ncbi:uncharacterized protein LOC122637646 [Vespula pensylvanica]|uniref:uncharacterized protein LOC122637646 n=1 Tax=Vespula pensylvanica TaxID=30213 RepID=UPI001CBA408D|nr:uncharacterized protein LOC122637646 [Vespula pensylvanica]